MKRKFTFLIAAAVMLLTMMATTGTMWGQVASFSRSGSTDNVTGGDFSTTFSGKTGYYQDATGDCYMQILNTTAYWTTTPSSISLAATIGGGSGNKDLANSVYVVLLDENGDAIGTQTVLTSHITTNTGDNYNISIPVANDVYGVKISHEKESGYNVRYYSFSLSFVAGGGGDTPSLSVTPTAIDFGSKEINPSEPYTETFTVTYANLTENLTVSVGEGLTGISVSPQEISKDGDGSQVVTVSYNPTSEGEISGNITVSNTADELSKTVAVSGSSYDPASVVIYERYTDAIVEGDYIIYNTNGAMKNVISSNRFANESVTVTNNTITNPESSIVWHIAADGDYWTIYNAAVNKYAGGTTSKNQGALLDEVNDHARWIITYQYSNFTIENYGRSQDNSDPANRYLRQNTTASAGWATYGSGTGYVPTLYKKAGATTYSVTYNANGATLGTVPTDNTAYSSGDEVTVLGNTDNLAKAGYVWAGWCMNAEGTGTVYGPDYTTTFEITQNTTLYAKWNAKTITGLAYTGTPTATQYDGQAFNPAGLTVTATFNDASQEDVTSDVVWTPNPLTTATTSVTGTYMELTVVVEGITVTYAPGSENNPYTVAQARAAIDAGTGTQGVYATGIVSAIVTPYGTNNYKNITFNMVDEAGDEVFLQAFRCIGDEAPDVAVNDIAVVYGNLTKYQTTYEFAQGCSVVSLEHPIITDPYIEADDVNIAYDAAGGNIAYTVENPVQGGQVTATTTSTWLTLGTDFTSPIAFTCDANEAGERTASVTLTYTYGAKTTVNKEVTVTQAGNPNVFDNIEDITEVGTAYSVKGTVVAINARGFVMGDGTGYVYYYKNASPTQAVNEMVTVSGTTGTYGQIIQFTNSATVTEATTSNYDGTPAATLITAVPNYSTGYHLSTYLEFEGALAKSGSNYLITVGEGQIQISYPTTEQGNALTALDGKTVHVKGYFSGINSSSKFTVMLESAEEVAVPAITLAQYEYNLNADGGDAVLQVTYTNMPANPQAEVIFYEANGTTTATYDWITASINANYNIAGHINVNEGDARSAYFKVKGKDANNNDVYSNLVTINQAAAGATIEFNNTSMTLAAGGESDRQLSFDYSGLGSNPTFSINYYEQDGTTPATYNHDWLTATIEGKKVNISAVANQGAERKAYFKVYGENGAVNTESNLVTITQGEAPTYAELPFSFNGGKADIENTDGLSQEGLGSDYNASSNPTTKLKFDGTGDWLLLQFNERPGTLTFDIKGNSFSGSTFKVQTSEDGISYTDLETYTDLGDTQNESFSNLDENVRYIKWIYTEKSSGNVGLGNIALAEYAAPVASITVTPATVDVTAEGEDDGILPIAYENLTITEATDFDIQYYDANNQPLSKDDEPDWMGAAVQDNATQDGYEVSYFVSENDGEARTAYFKVYALDANMELVYSNLITVSQEAYVAPTATIAVTPETVNVEASGEDEGSLAIAYENLTITDAGDFDIQYYDANNQPLEKEQEPDWMAAAVQANTTQDGYEVSYYIDPNEGAARTAYFKVYALDDNTEIVYSNLVTINQAAFVVDYATLPFEWEGGPRSEFEALNGTSTYGVGDYGDNQGVYRMKLDGTGDYIQVKTNELPGIVTIGVKMIGGATTSTLTVQGSADGTTFTNVEALTISGSQNDELTLSTTNDFAATDRYVRLLFTKGSNVGVGPITIAQVDLTPSITVAPATLNLNCDGGDGELTVTHKNLADDPQLNVIFVESDGETTTTYDWIQASINAAGNVAGHINTNTGEARTAYLKVTGRDADNNLIKSNLVTFNQAAYTEPSIVFETTTLDIVAGGENRTMSFDYEGLGQNPTFSINFYESDGTTPATYSWIEAEITQDDKVNISVTANEGAARSAYFKVSGVNGEVNALSNLVTINQAAYTQLATYSLVTSVDDIVSGKHYIIASSAADGAAYAMGNQNGNNRKGYAVTVANEQITEAEGVYEFVINTHETSSKDVVYTIYDAVTPGYLYASSSSANQLKTTTTLNDNGKWAIEISSTGAATITAQGSNSRKLMRYNPNNNSPIFACYATNTNIGNAPCLYVKDNDNNYEYYGMEISYEGTSIPNGETITVGAGSVMTVPNNFGNDNPAALVIKDGGQLIHESDVEATVQKRVSGYTYKSGDGWYFIASPVNGLSTDSVATGTYDLFIYNEPNAYWYSSTGTTAPFTTLERGVGYLYANTSDINLDFAGLMIKTNQNIEMNLSYTEAMGNLKGFNLMGNPFTRNLGTDDMKLGGADVASYYGFDNKGEEIVVRYIDADPIKPGQGFMVQATAANQKLVFNPGAKAESENNGYISIVAGNENGTDNAFIHFGNVNTLRKMTFSGDKSQVYVMNNGDDYAAARLDEAKGLVPVHFEAAGEGIYTITIEAKNLDLETLRLIDNFTGEEIDLLVEPTYTFKANSDEPANRFTLLFEKSTLGIDENDAENEVFAYQSGDEIYFNGEGTLQVFDVMGRFVMSREINGNDHISTSLFNTGVYVFRLVGETVMTQKIVVR